jgi:hypothetical protein
MIFGRDLLDLFIRDELLCHGNLRATFQKVWIILSHARKDFLVLQD